MALAEEFGEPLWCVGTGFRNTHLRAIAPTVSNSKLSGNVSPGIEPWAANVFTDQSAKGTFIRKNPTLQKLLKSKNIDTKETWDKILEDGGSVQDVKELSIEEKEVFKTFKEINQLELVRQAGVRQQYIDQSVSLNLAFPAEANPKWINKVHLDAWKKGIKTLYYMRTESVLRGDIAAKAMEDCVACDG
jgi:ribonucleoside-diphosphate reductase alpha chain